MNTEEQQNRITIILGLDKFWHSMIQCPIQNWPLLSVYVFTDAYSAFISIEIIIASSNTVVFCCCSLCFHPIHFHNCSSLS